MSSRPPEDKWVSKSTHLVYQGNATLRYRHRRGYQPSFEFSYFSSRLEEAGVIFSSFDSDSDSDLDWDWDWRKVNGPGTLRESGFPYSNPESLSPAGE